MCTKEFGDFYKYAIDLTPEGLPEGQVRGQDYLTNDSPPKARGHKLGLIFTGKKNIYIYGHYCMGKINPIAIFFAVNNTVRTYSAPSSPSALKFS